MSRNSYITEDGLEMARSQAVQAEAAGVPPCVNMNPVLLKPAGDRSSQVIVNGKVSGNMQAAEYFEYKSRLIPDIMAAYNDLAQSYDIIVIEGAGSPAEINLKTDDIVNMGMAEMAKSPVLLVADIDRGGAFASIYGTVMLLDEEERRFIKGMVINKFRGDVSLLEPGLVMISELTKIPVIGVVPYTQVDIEPEDSLSERVGNFVPDSERNDEYRESQYNLLADTVRSSVDMERIYEILEKGM
jgi:adenosylcobyric acid synthase